MMALAASIKNALAQGAVSVHSLFANDKHDRLYVDASIVIVVVRHFIWRWGLAPIFHADFINYKVHYWILLVERIIS